MNACKTFDNCDLLLARLTGEAQTDATPAGRMILQLKWLKKGPLPVDPDYTGTLRYIFTDGALSYLCRSPRAYELEIKTPLYLLMGLITEAAFR